MPYRLRHLPVIKCPALLQRITYCADSETTKAGHFIFWISLRKQHDCGSQSSHYRVILGKRGMRLAVYDT